jgi:hypothetical protein
VEQQLGFHLTDFHEIWYLNIFRYPVQKIRVSLKSDMNNCYFIWTPIYTSFLWSRLSQFSLEWKTI